MAYKMSVEELVNSCGIQQVSKFVGGKFVYEDRLYASRLANGVTKEELVARRDEALAYIKTEREKQERTARERQAKIDAIPGLKEIKAAVADLNKWHYEFNRSFEGECGGLGVREKPQYDIEGMKQQYPVAAAYIKAEAESERANYELAAIGRNALEAIINDPEHYEDALAEMDRATKEFTREHMWD